MSKVLFVVPGGNDLGGIITSTEQYVAGIREAGHEIDFMTVGFSKSPTRRDRLPRGKYANDFAIGVGTGALMHPTQGWRQEARLSLMNADDRAAFIQIAKKYDWIIWASVYGFNNPDTAGKTDWFEAIKKLKGKHIFMIHDDHFNDRYPWAHALAPYARLFIGVQPCSYDSLEGVAAPRAMVYTPLPPLPRTVEPLDHRRGFFSCQVWKGWKNGHRLVAAAPLMPKNSITFAGDGIQLRYLRSPTKCPEKWDGWWTAAMQKQQYAGVLLEPDRDAYLRRSRFLVDLSLRHNSGQYNRIVQEAMAQGCVVIADPRFLSGTSHYFKPHVHYLPIAADDTPAAIALTLKMYGGMDPADYTKMQKAARAALTVFDRKMLGQQIIDEANYLVGYTPDKAAVAAGKEAFKRTFGDES